MSLLSIIGIIALPCMLLIGATGFSIRSMSKAEIEKMLKEAEIEEILKKIETKKAPPTARMGAMCYSMAAPPARAEYVCPTCGEKTLYTKNQAQFVAQDLQSCRREFESIKISTKLLLSLSESSYCKHCQPDAEKQELKLTVTYEGGKVHTVAPVTKNDLQLLRDLLSGKLSHKAFTEGPHPLKENSSRLRELLGMEFPGQPDAEKQAMKLTFSDGGGKVHTVASFTEYDLQLLRDLLSGKLSHKAFNEGSHPLKKYSFTLRLALGMELPGNSDKA